MKRIVLFGAIGAYSAAFSRALAPHVDLVACIVQRPVDGFVGHILRHRPAPVEALGFACPVFSVGNHWDDQTYVHLRKRFAADLAISVGFPHKLPVPQMQSLARLGGLNLHPALLPKDRGPCPIFWSLKRGDEQTGVTLHLLTEEVDRGDILLSAQKPMPVGHTAVQHFEQLGTLGGELVVKNLEMLLSGQWHLHPQGDDSGAWARRPKHPDLEIDPTEWTAKALFNFVRGVRMYGSPWAKLADDVYYFRDAMSFDPGNRIPGEFVIHRGELTAAVKDGTVSFLLET